MTLLVPFDGSDLSKAALARANEYASSTGAEIVALTVVPDDPDYARERGWLAPPDTFDVDVVARKLEQTVRDVAPDATFRSELAEEAEQPTSTTVDVVRTIRRVAAEVDATVLFVGSENAGRVSVPLASVGNPIAEDTQYDVFIVRHPRSDE